MLAAIGLAIGIPAALALTRWMGDLLAGVTSSDPITYVVVAGVLTLAAQSRLGTRRW